MVIIENYSKSDPNIFQNAPNCTILKNLFGDIPPNLPPPPQQSAWLHHAQRMSLRNSNISKSENKFLPPPPAKSWLRP